MKSFLSLLLLLFSFDALSAQTREILFLDAANGQPVPDVNIFNPETLEGFISNQEGRAKIRFDGSSLLFSHIGYETIDLLPGRDSIGETVSLTPKAFELDQVVLYDVDLEKKLEYVLENYSSLYEITAKTFDCTYKERLVVNEAITRLAQVQLKWWSRNYELDFEKSLYKQNQFSLIATDYSKVGEDENSLTTSGFIPNKYLLQYIHLNYYPIFLTSYGKDFLVKSVEGYDGGTKIVFDGKIEINGELVSLLEDSRIYFDNDTGAITKVELRMQYQNNVKEDVSRKEGIPYTATIKMHHLELSFNKLPNEKLVPASFHSFVTLETEYQGKRDEAEILQSMYFTQTGEAKKIAKRDRINLDEPFYENFPMNQESQAKMLLSEEEEAFIRQL